MFFERKKKININDGYKQFLEKSDAILVDVREKDEYAMAHLPKSINIPLSNIESITSSVADKSKQIYVYCRSGARSEKARIELEHMGYKNVINIGGILDFSGSYE